MTTPEILTGIRGGKTSASRVLLLGVAVLVLSVWIAIGVGIGWGGWLWDTWSGYMNFGAATFLGAAGAFGLNEIGTGLAARQLAPQWTPVVDDDPVPREKAMIL